MKAVILAGGKGTRLGESETPKVMIKIGDKPVIEHQIKLLRINGITEIIICVKHLSHVIKKYFGNGEKFGVNISYSEEIDFLGTAGAVKFAEKTIKDDFLLLYGDVMTSMNLKKFIDFHEKAGGIASIVIHKSDHPYDSDIVDVDSNNRIVKFWRPSKEEKFRNLTNAAIFAFKQDIMKHIPNGKFSDFGKDILPELAEKKIDVFGYNTDEYIKDMGTEERLGVVRNDYTKGKIFQKGVFLDRDGVINKEVSFLFEQSQMSLIEGSAAAIKKFNDNGFKVIVVTNQPVVARNMCSEKDIKKIHEKMISLLSESGASIDAIYYCPHHPDKGFPEENPKYKIECECRKPSPGMIFQGSREFHVDPEKSFLVGDRTTDIMAGKNAGCMTILVKTGNGGRDKKYNVKSDYVCKNLLEAAELIIKTQNSR